MKDETTVIPWPVGAPAAPALDVRVIRDKLGLGQAEFARTFGFSRAALRRWEAGEPVTHPTIRVLLTLIDRDPAAVRRALGFPG